MFKTFKKIILSSLSILGVSLLFWVLLILNPQWSYANETQYDFVTVYHNQDLPEQAQTVINDAVNIIKKSELFNEETSIQLCLNDDNLYPNIHPLVGQPTAFAVLNKTVFKNCKIDFNKNVVLTEWAVNNFEKRNFNLTWLLAHEFSHNLQNQDNLGYVIKSTLGKINWKLEGHAEYISRQFQKDGALKKKIKKYLLEEQNEHNGLPVFELEDGTKQIFSYYKYALVIQYLMEEKKLDFKQVCQLESSLDKLFSEMIEWSKN